MIDVAGQAVETSLAVDIAARLVRVLGRARAHEVIDHVFDALSNVDGAALAFDWPLWARPKQVPTGSWSSWGYLTGRGWGKTFGIGRWINGEVEAGRARCIGLAAQDEANSIALQVLGPSGLVATAPPWFRPEWEATAMQLVWPNGARAIVRTPEVPGKIRGFDYDLTWVSEIQSWSTATRDEAMLNFQIATRVGLARLIWDATPKRRHPLLRALLGEAEADPSRHRVIRGTTYENAINLADGYIEEQERRYGGTLQGREELLGEMLAESESALVMQEWIKRRPKPDAVARKVLSVDPAITARRGSDTTGIVLAALAFDGAVLVCEDRSGKLPAHVWAEIVLDVYARERCDCLIVETNKGGDLLYTTLRAIAPGKALQIVRVGKEEKPRHIPGVVHVKEVYAKGSKEDRARPAATAYERGRVFHVQGANLTSLEDTITTWEPTPNAKSPGDLDALAHAVNELLDLTTEKPNPEVAFKGLDEVTKALFAPVRPPTI